MSVATRQAEQTIIELVGELVQDEDMDLPNRQDVTRNMLRYWWKTLEQARQEELCQKEQPEAVTKRKCCDPIAQNTAGLAVLLSLIALVVSIAAVTG